MGGPDKARARPMISAVPRIAFAVTVFILLTTSLASGCTAQTHGYDLDPSSSEVSVPEATGEWSLFNHSIMAGWNLISLPLIDYGYTASTLGLLTGDVIFGHNSSSGLFDKVFIVGISPPSMDFPIEPSNGYMVYARANQVVPIYGTVPTTTQKVTFPLPVGGGWALIGFVGFSHRHVSNIPAMCSGGTVSVVVRLPPDYIILYQTAIIGIPFTDFVLNPGEGYWAYFTSGVTLTYTP